MVTRAPDPALARRAKTAAKLAIAVGFAGFGLKVAGWLFTGSDAVFSDALESIVNIVASIGAYLALKYAERAPYDSPTFAAAPACPAGAGNRAAGSDGHAYGWDNAARVTCPFDKPHE